MELKNLTEKQLKAIINLNELGFNVVYIFNTLYWYLNFTNIDSSGEISFKGVNIDFLIERGTVSAVVVNKIVNQQMLQQTDSFQKLKLELEGLPRQEIRCSTTPYILFNS